MVGHLVCLFYINIFDNMVCFLVCFYIKMFVWLLFSLFSNIAVPLHSLYTKSNLIQRIDKCIYVFSLWHSGVLAMLGNIGVLFSGFLRQNFCVAFFLFLNNMVVPLHSLYIYSDFWFVANNWQMHLCVLPITWWCVCKCWQMYLSVLLLYGGPFGGPFLIKIYDMMVCFLVCSLVTMSAFLHFTLFSNMGTPLHPLIQRNGKCIYVFYLWLHGVLVNVGKCIYLFCLYMVGHLVCLFYKELWHHFSVLFVHNIYVASFHVVIKYGSSFKFPIHKTWFLIWYKKLANVFMWNTITSWAFYKDLWHDCVLLVCSFVKILVWLIFTLFSNMGIPLHSLYIKPDFWFDTNNYQMYLCVLPLYGGPFGVLFL